MHVIGQLDVGIGGVAEQPGKVVHVPQLVVVGMLRLEWIQRIEAAGERNGAFEHAGEAHRLAVAQIGTSGRRETHRRRERRQPGVIAVPFVAPGHRLHRPAPDPAADVGAEDHRQQPGDGGDLTVEAGIGGPAVVAVSIGQPGNAVLDLPECLVLAQQVGQRLIDDPAHADAVPEFPLALECVDLALQAVRPRRQFIHPVLCFARHDRGRLQFRVGLQEVVERPVTAVTHAGIEGQEVDRTPFQREVALALLATAGTRVHAPAVGRAEIRVTRTELLVLPVAAHGQVQGRMQGEAVAQGQAGPVVARICQRGVAQNRAGAGIPVRIARGEVRKAACGVGIAVRLCAPQVGVEVQPAAAGRLEAVLQVPGIGRNPAERPLDAPIVRCRQDARRHDLAVVRQRSPPGRLQLLVIVDLPAALDQPGLLFAGSIGHFIAGLEVARQRGDVVDALVLELLAPVLVVVGAALGPGEVVAALAPGVGGHQVDVVATHAQRQAPGLVLAIEGVVATARLHRHHQGAVVVGRVRRALREPRHGAVILAGVQPRQAWRHRIAAAFDLQRSPASTMSSTSMVLITSAPPIPLCTSRTSPGPLMTWMPPIRLGSM